MQLDSSIMEIKGIGEKSAKVFEKAGIVTFRDLLYYFPRDYEFYEPPVSFEQLEEGKIMAVAAFVTKTPTITKGSRLQITTTTVTEGQRKLQLLWFRMPFLRNTLKRGYLYIFRGRVSKKGNLFVMEQPKVYTSAQYGNLEGKWMPIYPLVSGLTNHMVQKSVGQILENQVLIQEYLSKEIRERYELADLNYALSQIHYPEDKNKLLQARKRLVFEEFYKFASRIKKMKAQMLVYPNHYPMPKGSEAKKLIEQLPFDLTGAQKKVWSEIKADFQKETPMARLIQGDVGSGKTIVAFLAMLTAAENGYQSALMAPTEVLAKQHYQGFLDYIEKHDLPCKVQLLVGSMTAKEKRTAYEKIQEHQVDLVIGTHALIQEKVEFSHLGLVITDEQHRFGVCQRESLQKKGDFPHVLVMSATPIPRTLAMILYGDLAISVIDEMPANRIPIKNCVVDDGYRRKAYEFIRKQVEAGHQVYIVCPMIEENQDLELENVLEYTERLRQELPGIQIGSLHGKMKAQEKNEIMEAYARNEIQILVSTTVIEVGINVPNATVMMVENAERFGLSQLHQLRGRVGRGSAQSYCIFISNSKSKETKQRLHILNQSNDGFFVAEEDLKLRGPGDLFGIRQSGDLAFLLGDIFTDAEILKNAWEAVEIYGPGEIQDGFQVQI